jgi:DNA-binding MarR family transcriptional regulator
MKRAAMEYAKLSLSIQEARLLIALQHHSTVGVGQLAEITCIEPSALSHVLRRLNRRGLIRRRRLQRDGRAVEVVLTAAGRRMALQCLKKSKVHESDLLSDISSEERQALRRILSKMYANTEGWAFDSDISSVARAGGQRLVELRREGKRA